MMIENSLQLVLDYLNSSNSIFRYNETIYLIPLFILALSFLIHLKKAVSYKYFFTRRFCQFVIFTIVIEITGLSKYCFDRWSVKELTDTTNIMFAFLMIINGIITLIAPLIVKSGEKAYQNMIERLTKKEDFYKKHQTLNFSKK